MAALAQRCFDRMMGQSPNTASTFREEFEKWCKEAFNTGNVPEDFMMLICTCVKQCMETMGKSMDSSPSSKESLRSERHQRFKDAIEELRRMNLVPEKESFIKSHFSELTEKEKKVLMEIANDMSKKQHAELLGMTMDEVRDTKHKIEEKLK